jgi:hypothetical protein
MVIIYRCPEPEKLTTKTSGWKWTRQHYVLVGLDDVSSAVIQVVISQISRQPVSTGRSRSRVCPKKNLHTAIDNESLVRAWDLTSVEIDIIFYIDYLL